MKKLIIYYSKYGSVRNCALQLKDALEDTEIVCVEFMKQINWEQYDCFIFGTNILNGKIPRIMQKCLKKYKKYFLNKKRYGYVLCINKEMYIEKYFHYMANALETNLVYYLGGVLDASQATGMEALLIESFRKSLLEKKISLTGINQYALEEFIEMIRKDEENV